MFVLKWIQGGAKTIVFPYLNLSRDEVFSP